jgi:ribosomal-protein-serine acetyltransferase
MEAGIDLQFPTPEDTPGLTAAVQESLVDLIPWMDWAHEAYDIETARWWIDAQPAKREKGEAFEYMIKDSQGEILGACGVNRISAAPFRFANLGYWIRSSATGKGIATAAVLRLIDTTFRDTQLVRLEMVVAVGNRRSQRVAEKVGAIYEGTFRCRLWPRAVRRTR